MRLLTKLVVLVTLGMGSVAHAELPEHGLLVAADFNTDIQNALGGFHNRFQGGQSSASTYMSASVRRGEAGRSLRISANQNRDGFCGAWMHLFDFRSEKPTYFDATRYSYLTFWVRGEKGGERFAIQFADRQWIAREDSVRIGSVNALLNGAVTTEWQQVIISLEGMDEVDLSELGGITFLFHIPGKHTIYIDDVAFKTADDIPTPITQAGDVPEIITQPKPKSMWVWHTDDLLYSKDGRKQDKLFEFCNAQGIETIWLQLLYSFEPRVDLGPPSPRTAADAKRVRCEITKPALFKALLRKAHAAGVRVLALDGYPEYTQKEYHHLPLSIVDAIIAFNQDNPPEERFDGIHFDNEPHLLIGWSDWRRRERILREFLKVNAQCQRRVREHSTMEFGVDIPFWWQHNEPGTDRPIGLVDFNGARKPASYHCIDILDSVGIMNYRDTADGADGMIVHGRQLLLYGDTAKNAKIHMGVETFKYDPTEIWLVLGLPKRQFSRVLDQKGRDYSFLSRVEGFKLHYFDDGGNVHVGIQIPSDMSQERLAALDRVAGELAKRYGVPLNPKRKRKIKEFHDQTLDALRDDPGWSNPSTRPIPNPDGRYDYPGIHVTRLMQPKITFGDDSLEHMQMQTESAGQFFSLHPSFSGFAIHYYRTFEKMVQADATEKAQPQANFPTMIIGD